jgi:multicomponent K+:H+ antiporter subunit E
MKSDTLDRRAGWLDHPVLSLLLAASWLALSRSLEPVHLLSAALLWDIVLSNITVARLVLGPMSRPQPAWLRVPLASEHHRVNALFASIITMTPGTVSAVVDETAHCIWVHALNCDDAAGMVADMKARYEAPLMAVFGLEGEGAA